MNIKTINIKNFKGFADISFTLNDHFTVFIGENATGKTSVLDALAVAAGSYLLGINGPVARRIKPEEIRLVMIDGQPRQQLPVTIEASGAVNGHTISWKREILTQKTTTKGANQIRLIAEAVLKRSRVENYNSSPLLKTFPVIAYHSTCRLCSEHEKIDFQKQNEGALMAYTNCLSEKSSSKEFLSWFKTQENAISKFDQEIDKAHFQAFKAAILALVPDERWTDMAFDYKNNNLTGIFIDSQGKKHKLAYQQLSDGFRNVIKLAADIAYRCIQLNPHLRERAVTDTPGIVLIDEIDLHLHPNWQRRIVADLKRVFPNIQFVATTHSPFIVQSLDGTELINLDEFSNEMPPEQPTVSPDELPINKVITELMGVTNIRSDNFEERVKDAQEALNSLHKDSNAYTLDDYVKISKTLGKMLVEETNDPEYKAFLLEKEKGESDTE